MLPEDQAIEFMRAINAQAAQNSVSILGSARTIGRTNQFFMEQAQSVTVQSGERQLVDFLYGLSSRSSMIRVRDLSVRPDQPRQQLAANIKFVASYQKNTTVRRAAPATPVPATKSAVPPVTTPPGKSAALAATNPPAKSTTPPKTATTSGKSAPPAGTAAPVKSATPSKSTMPAKGGTPTDKRP